MRPHEVRLTAAARRAFERCAAAAWPREAVAALGGARAGDVVTVRRVRAFADAGHAHGFVVPAPAFAAAEAELRAHGCAWVGFVHSHPGGSAAPSLCDRAELWRDCVQLIAGAAAPGRWTFAAFWLDARGCVPLALALAAHEDAAVAAP